MRLHLFILGLMLLPLCLLGQTPQTQGSQQPATATAAQTPATEESMMRNGFAAFNSKDFQSALSIFRQMVITFPDNVQAHNMLGNTLMRTKQYRDAAASFKRALELAPDEQHNLNGIMRAYTYAGMTEEREQERAHIRQLEHEGKLTNQFCYMIDAYTSGHNHVEAFECPELAGRFKTRYWFYVYDPQEQPVMRFALESSDMDQTLWAKDHPKEAAAGQREFSLDGYGQNTHSLYRFFDGEPSYEDVRAEVAKALAGQSKPEAGLTVNYAPTSGDKSKETNSPSGKK